MKPIIILTIVLISGWTAVAQQPSSVQRIEDDAQVRSVDSKSPEEIAAELVIENSKMEDMLLIKRPKLVFDFGGNEMAEIEKTEKIRGILDDYWKSIIRYKRSLKIYGMSFTGKDSKSSKKWGRQHLRLINILSRTPIQTPFVSRKIKIIETYRVAWFLDEVAEEIAIRAIKVSRDFKDVSIINQESPNVGNCIEKSGTVKIRVTYFKSGELKNVRVVTSSGCNDFDFNAVEAAKKIEFTPAMLEGKPITVSSLIVYSFKK